MSTSTTKIGLIKPAAGEKFSRATYNNNLDLVDTFAGKAQVTYGTYTPDWQGFTNLGTSFNSQGSYIKIGRMVMATVSLVAGTGASMGTSFLRVTLPFTSASDQGTYAFWYGTMGLHSPGITGLIYPFLWPVGAGATQGQFFSEDTNSANKNALVSPGSIGVPFGKDDVIRGSITYIAES